MPSHTSRQGLTLIEVVVLCVMLSFLVFLLLPAIYNSGGDARRRRCLNNTQQLALGCVNHEMTNGTFPLAIYGPCADDQLSVLGRIVPGTSDGPFLVEDGQENWRNDSYSWIVPLLPFVDQQALYDALQRTTDGFRRTAFDPALTLDTVQPSRHPATIALRLLACPSYAGPRTAQAKDNYGLPANSRVSAGNYVALSAATRGSRTVGIVDDAAPELGGIIISRRQPGDSGVRGEQVVDGASHTLLLCETKQEVYSSWFSGQSAWVVGFPPDTPPELELATDGQLHVAQSPSGSQPTSLNYGRPYQTDDASLAPPWYATELAGENRDWGPSSNHRGGIVMHAFADGHTQELVDKIDATVYFRLITRAGEEPSAAEAF